MPGSTSWVPTPRAGGQPTIYDVARACGVAASTVSRAFSRPGRVSAETAQRIRDAALELGYRAAPTPHSGPVSRTGLVALIMPDVINPFYFEIIQGAEAALAAAGYDLVLTETRGPGRLQREVIEETTDRVDGFVLATTRLSDAAIRTAAKLRPIVVLNRAVTDVPSVLTDNSHGMWCALHHLAGLGHDTVTYVAGPDASYADGMRWRAACDLGPDLGVRVRRIGPFSPDVKGGGAAAAELLAHPAVPLSPSTTSWPWA